MSATQSPSDAWFHQARYGMFIHWGVYSVAGRGEWVANRERISFEDYRCRYALNFDAKAYDPETWAALAKEAGMGYAVLTARHHDGFALWPTRTSEFHAGNIGPKRDLVGSFVKAFRRAGLRVGLYYSPADWFHPDYPGAYFRDWPQGTDWRSGEARLRMTAYYREQLRELMTWYGPIDYLWYDGCLPEDLRSREVNEEMLRLQPRLLINERNGEPFHVKICEQTIRAPESTVLWEACMTLNENWGYHAGDQNWKSERQVIRMLTETAAKAGNLLLNIGPRGDGSIPEEATRILRASGEWLRRNDCSIRNTSRSPFTWVNWGRVTTRGHRIFLHIWNTPGSELCFAEIKNRVRSAAYLDGGTPVAFEQNEKHLLLKGLAIPLNDPIATVIVLEVDGEPEALTAQTTFWIPE